MKHFISALRRYILTGLLTLLPISITVWVILWVFRLFDAWSVDVTTQLWGKRIPGAGLIVTLAVLMVTGAIATNVLGRRLLASLDRALAKVPLVRSVYTAIRQLVDTFTSPQKAAFKKVVMIEYPRRGCWSIAFVTAEPSAFFSAAADQLMVSVFVATTPNPTSGFFLGVPQNECIPLPISVEDAFKLIISGGAIEPSTDSFQTCIAKGAAQTG